MVVARMGTLARRSLRIVEVGLLVSLALSVSCGKAPGEQCSESEAPPEPSSAKTLVSPQQKADSLRLAEGADTPAITVTVAGAPDDRVLPIDAIHGSFDEPLVFVAATASRSISAAPEPYGEPSPAAHAGAPAVKQLVPVAITSAYSGSGEPVPLRLLDAYSGRDVTALEMTPGQHAYLRVAGDGFSREATYRANLTIFGAEPVVYRLRIASSKPHRPLGLRASKWADTFADVPIIENGGQKAVSLTLPVDAASDAPAPYHVAVRPSTDMVDGAQPLPACGVVARASMQPDRILVKLPPLSPGRYTGVIEIQGEPLAVDLTLKNPFYWVWLLVATGATLSLGLREYLRYRTAREQAERNIAAKEREIEKKTEGLGLLTWDELSVRNVVRLARGRKSYLALDDVAPILEDATPRERPERVAIDQALNETSLPAPLRKELRTRLEKLSFICSRDEARQLDRALSDLAREAQSGFQSELVRWLSALQDAFNAVEERIIEKLDGEPTHIPPATAKQVKAALHVLELLVEDARALALDSKLSPGQAEVLSKVEPALAQLEKWVVSGHVPSDIVSWIHCDFRSIEPLVEPEVPELARELRLRARGVGAVLNANEEITFEVVSAPGLPKDAPVPEDAPVYACPVPVEWWIDKQRVVRGGTRLTYVFQSAGWLGWRRRRVEVRVKGRAIATWYERIQRPELSIAVYERTWSLFARAAASLVGVIVTGAAAVGVLWSNKAFGGWADYISAALTGLGADLAIVAGGGKLLDNVLAAVVGRRREDET